MKNISAFFLFLVLVFSAYAGDKHWAYQDSETGVGPSGWGSLPGDELCSIGKTQAPIDVLSSSPFDPKAPKIKTHYEASPIRLTNNGHSMQMGFEAGSTLNVGDKNYRLLQFHFHAKSEHSIDGKFSAMELHLVHVDQSGRPAAVIAVLMNEGKHNSALDPIFSQFSSLASQPGEKMDSAVKFDPSVLVLKNSGYFTYAGSLTTPPCSEGIQWFVLKKPIEVDSAQIRMFTGVRGFEQTARPTQAVDQRKVVQTK